MVDIINPCDREEQPPAPEPSTGGGSGQGAVVDDINTDEIVLLTPTEETNEYPVQTIIHSATSANRTVFLINEEYYLQNPLFLSETEFMNSGLFMVNKSKNMTEEELENLDYFRGVTMNVWTHMAPSNIPYNPDLSSDLAGALAVNVPPRFPRADLQPYFLGTLVNSPVEARKNRSLKIPIITDISRSSHSLTTGFNTHTLKTNFLVKLDDYWTKNQTSDYETFNNSGARFFDIYLRGDNSEFYSPDRHVYFAKGLFQQDKFFYDNVFETALPFSKKEEGNLLFPGANTVTISMPKTTFKYFNFKGEEITTELKAPSLYYEFFKKAKTNLVDNIDSPPSEPIETPTVQKFSGDEVASFETVNASLTNMAANSVTITIDTKQGNPIAEMLKKYKMDKHVLEHITSQNYETKIYTQVNDEVVHFNDSRFTARGFTSSNTQNDISRSGIKTKVWRGIIDKIKQIYEPNLALSTLYAQEIRRYQLEIGVARERDDLPNPEHRGTGGYREGVGIDANQYPLGFHNYDSPRILHFEDSINGMLFIKELFDFIKKRKAARTYSEIISGRKAFSEVVGYHVIKIDADTEEIIQDFYFSDSNAVQEINFVDTQILFNKKYIYRVNTINFVIGSKYTYEVPEPGQEGSNRQFAMVGGAQQEFRSLQIDIGVTSEIDICLIEAPYFEKQIHVYDKPPVFPLVTFLPYMGVEDKISVLVQANTGNYTEKVIKVKDSDTEIQNTMVTTQEKSLEDPIIFGSDTLPTKYEILVLDQEPESYSDFSSAVSRILTARGKTGFATFNIEPNKNYYYIFRAHDEGGISNPTEVYRIMLVSYQNGIFLDLETIEMKKKINSDPFVFEKTLKIEPAFKQKAIKFKEINFDTATTDQLRNFYSSAPDQTLFDVGPVEEDTNVDMKKLWNKKFKIRIKSKHTDKKVDIKVKFKNKKINYGDSERFSSDPGTNEGREDHVNRQPASKTRRDIFEMIQNSDLM